MPWSAKQHRLFEAAAHSQDVAKRVGIPMEQAKQMAHLLDTMPGPILAFCRSGARSTNLYMLAQQVG